MQQQKAHQARVFSMVELLGQILPRSAGSAVSRGSLTRSSALAASSMTTHPSSAEEMNAPRVTRRQGPGHRKPVLPRQRLHDDARPYVPSPMLCCATLRAALTYTIALAPQQHRIHLVLLALSQRCHHRHRVS